MGPVPLEQLVRPYERAGVLGFNQPALEQSELRPRELAVRFTDERSYFVGSDSLQLLKARDNPQGQAIAAVFESTDCKLIEAISKRYEGPHPTPRQKNPHPKTSLAYATWVIGRLGGWTGYYGKPGPKTLNWGLQAFHNIKQGADIHAKDM